MSKLWHIKNWFKVGTDFSWALNFHTLYGFLGLYNKKSKFLYSEAQKKHKYILGYIKNNFGNVIANYKGKEEGGVKPDRKKIWTLWWQGEDDAPKLIKACWRRMREVVSDAETIIISKNNYSEYIELPEYIIAKCEKGYISFAQLSDIIRYRLLRKYGGLWLDSTIYLGNCIPDDTFELPIFYPHTRHEKTIWVQENRFHGFVVGSRKDGKLVSFMDDMFMAYWEKENTVIDYLLVDYLIMTAYENFLDIRDEIDSLPLTSECLYDLVNLLNSPFDEQVFSDLMSECEFSKLDWHKKVKENTAGLKTYYSHLISGL